MAAADSIPERRLVADLPSVVSLAHGRGYGTSNPTSKTTQSSAKSDTGSVAYTQCDRSPSRTIAIIAKTPPATTVSRPARTRAAITCSRPIETSTTALSRMQSTVKANPSATSRSASLPSLLAARPSGLSIRRLIRVDRASWAKCGERPVADELSRGSVGAEIAPAEDGGDEAHPPRVSAAELRDDGEALVFGEEAVLGCE